MVIKATQKEGYGRALEGYIKDYDFWTNVVEFTSHKEEAKVFSEIREGLASSGVHDVIARLNVVTWSWDFTAIN